MSSAGQIVGGIVGGIVGFIVGGPAGALKGIYVGATIGGVIDPPKGPTIRGPRLDDLSVQTATYGAFIPRVYGTTAIHGNVFWVQGDSLIEVKKETDSGGKGGPTQTTETFEYFATFAVGLCEGPIEGVRRIWIGGQLWYEAGQDASTIVIPGDPPSTIAEKTARLVANVIVSNDNANNFTLYKGDDTQLADPLMQADKGAANVPAYRGLAYIVFDRLPLANYSNSLMGAQVKVEVVRAKTSSYGLSAMGSTAVSADPRAMVAVNHYLYASCSGLGRLQCVDIGNPLMPTAVSTVTTGVYPGAMAYYDGYIYVACNTSNLLQVFSLDIPESPVLVGSVPTAAESKGVAVNWPYVYVSTKGGSSDLIQVFNATSQPPFHVTSVPATAEPHAIAYSDGYVFLTSITGNLLSIFQTVDGIPVFLSSIGISAACYAMVVSGSFAYVASYTSGLLQCIDVSNPAAPVIVGSAGGLNDTNSLSYNAGFVFSASQTTGHIKAVDVRNPAAPVIVATLATSGSPHQTIFAGGVLWLCDTSYDTVESYLWQGDILASVSGTLSSIVSSECLKSKLLLSADIDTSELNDTVRGYRIGALGAIRSGLDPLRAAWPFDVVQSGYKIKFKKRGGASVATITAGELDAHAAGDAPGISITDSREMDLILPYKVGVKYLDTTREYDTNEQYAERLNTDAVNESSVDLPIVFTASEAAGKAETLLYMYWLERYDVAFKLPPSYAYLEPGDVITIEATHATYSLRLTSVNHTPDGRLECQAKYSSASIYTPAAQGSEGESVGATLTLAGPSAYQLLDIPMLRDVDNVSGFPVAMTGYLAGWPGGVLFRSEDAGETWLDLAGFVSPGTVMGYATNTLAAHGGTVYDFASTLTVRLYQGTLSSVTEAQLFAAQNWFAYGKDGRWEIIAARTATLQGDGSYILRDFLRGQLGTEWATGLHAANDSFVRLNAADLEFVNVNASTIGSERHYRGITAGKSLDSDGNRAFTYRGVNLECLSPVHATGSRHPTTNDWTLTWVRRSRFSGWRDLVDASLGETTESYEVDIFSSATYTTLKRTLTSATPTVTYTSANQVTDFGSNQATLYLKIYQLSSVVGRGYPLTISLTR